MQPVPLITTMESLREAGCLEGPEVGCRVVSDTSPLELLMLGKVAIGTRTPREATTRIAYALPNFCTREHVTVQPGATQSQFGTTTRSSSIPESCICCTST